MTAPGIADALVERGLDPSDRAAKASLFDRALETLGARATTALWVPGRVEVFGKHTDYAGGRSLVCAAPRGFAVVARPRDDATVNIVAADGSKAFHLYADTVERRLARNFPEALRGADIAFASDLTEASGMSSSSALVVGLAATLSHVRGLERTAAWRQNISDALEASDYFACIENGLSYGSLDGDAGVGTHGGSEDHAAILTAVRDELSAFAFVPLRLLQRVRMPDSWSFVVATSRMRAEKTGGAQGHYNRLSNEVRALVDLWNRHHPAAPSLAAVVATDARAVHELHALVDAKTKRQRDSLHRRLDHFVREDERVLPALAAFGSADAAELGRLSADSQQDADLLLRNQVDETRALAASARAHGAFAACSFGAGFGGSVWALVETDRARSFAASWHPGAFVMRPSLALTRVTSA